MVQPSAVFAIALTGVASRIDRSGDCVHSFQRSKTEGANYRIHILALWLLPRIVYCTATALYLDKKYLQTSLFCGEKRVIHHGPGKQLAAMWKTDSKEISISSLFTANLRVNDEIRNCEAAVKAEKPVGQFFGSVWSHKSVKFHPTFNPCAGPNVAVRH